MAGHPDRLDPGLRQNQSWENIFFKGEWWWMRNSNPGKRSAMTFFEEHLKTGKMQLPFSTKFFVNSIGATDGVVHFGLCGKVKVPGGKSYKVPQWGLSADRSQLYIEQGD